MISIFSSGIAVEKAVKIHSIVMVGKSFYAFELYVICR